MIERVVTKVVKNGHSNIISLNFFIFVKDQFVSFVIGYHIKIKSAFGLLKITKQKNQILFYIFNLVLYFSPD